MDTTFLSYLERLELLAFFAAYPLVYAIVHVITGSSNRKNIKKISSFLPYAYALVGILYLGLQLKNLYPDYSLNNIRHSVQQPFLKVWALLSLLFWIPALAKKPVVSLLHSLVFFFFLVQDLFLKSSPDKNIVRNDMKIYTDSILINLGALLIILILFWLFKYFRNRILSQPRH